MTDITASTTQLLQYFKNYFPLNEEEEERLQVHFTERNVKRRGFILQQGEVCRHFTFVVSGCFKMYAVDSKGNEHNLQFAAENDWITELDSFYSEKPAEVYIEAIEPSVILQIKRPDLIRLYTTEHKIDHNFRVIIENKFIELQKRVLQSISSTTEERYQYFLNQYPKLSQRIPNTQIASYLGITPEFLSKVRKNILRNL
ncbi:Crp/Fnr family transcriptional regulator [Mucilaginibacter sp.]|uniref:Crp/Fnr family transcriptional regulator n=1 Tax=Mucilaginibacter sp. TaxID=1882438 RepID=UPI0025E186EB|nr:Crp/Fnr family transcriptional regulator [Mucilaginibacter sp.]